MPWFHEAARRDPDAMAHLYRCEKCMQANPRIQRQAMGCGYEPALVDAIAWTPEGLKLRDDERLEFCAGYTARLPEVIEIARARSHWNKGAIESFCGGQPSEWLLMGIEILDASANELQQALMTPKHQGGLQEDR